MWSRLFCRGEQPEEKLLLDDAQNASKSSCLTNTLINANIFGEFLTLPMNTVDLAVLVDLISENEKEWFGFSKAAVVIAGVLSLYFLVCSAYLHYILNKNHLENDDEHAALAHHSVWKKLKNISGTQRVALVGHTLDHAVAIAAAIAMTIELFTSKAQISLENRFKIMIQSIGFFVGLFCTLADAGTDLEALQIYNTRKNPGSLLPQ